MGPPPLRQVPYGAAIAKRVHRKGWKADDGTHVRTREYLDSQEISGREIARRLGVSRDAVAKYADQQDFSSAPTAPKTRPGCSVLTGFEHHIEASLVVDQRRNYKQRHTAKRVFDRMVQENSYTGA